MVTGPKTSPARNTASMASESSTRAATRAAPSIPGVEAARPGCGASLRRCHVGDDRDLSASQRLQLGEGLGPDRKGHRQDPLKLRAVALAGDDGRSGDQGEGSRSRMKCCRALPGVEDRGHPTDAGKGLADAAPVGPVGPWRGHRCSDRRGRPCSPPGASGGRLRWQSSAGSRDPPRRRRSPECRVRGRATGPVRGPRSSATAHNPPRRRGRGQGPRGWSVRRPDRIARRQPQPSGRG